MKAGIVMALLVVPMLQAAHAQGGGGADAQAIEGLREIRDSIASLNQSTWWAFWGSFLIGIAVVVTAIVSSWRYARHLGRQVRQAAGHIEVIERDMRDRKRPRVPWAECRVRQVPDFRTGASAQFIHVAITNVGDVGATRLSGHVVYGMASSLEELEGAKEVEIQMGAIPPNATRHQHIPVSGREAEDAGSGHCFRFKITLWYSGVVDTRYEYGLAGALVGHKVTVTEILSESRA